MKALYIFLYCGFKLLHIYQPLPKYCVGTLRDPSTLSKASQVHIVLIIISKNIVCFSISFSPECVVVFQRLHIVTKLIQKQIKEYNSHLLYQMLNRFTEMENKDPSSLSFFFVLVLGTFHASYISQYAMDFSFSEKLLRKEYFKFSPFISCVVNINRNNPYKQNSGYSVIVQYEV